MSSTPVPGVGLKYGPPLNPLPTTHGSDLVAYIRLMWQVCMGQIAPPGQLSAQCWSFFRGLSPDWDPAAYTGHPTQEEMTGGNLAGLTPRAEGIAVQIYEILTPVGTPSQPGPQVPRNHFWWLVWIDGAGRKQPPAKREAVLRDLWRVVNADPLANRASLLPKINLGLESLGSRPIAEDTGAPIDEVRAFGLSDLELVLGPERADNLWQLGRPLHAVGGGEPGGGIFRSAADGGDPGAEGGS